MPDSPAQIDPKGRGIVPVVEGARAEELLIPAPEPGCQAVGAEDVLQ
jgi:hypothetical protein